MEVAEELATGVAAALRAADLPASVHYCAYHLDWSENAGNLAYVAMILDSDNWDDATANTCRDARTAGRAALETRPVTPVFICRTRPEHQGFTEREAGYWTALDGNDAC